MRGYINRARKFVILKNISIVRSLYCDVKLKLYYSVLGTTVALLALNTDTEMRTSGSGSALPGVSTTSTSLYFTTSPGYVADSGGLLIVAC